MINIHTYLVPVTAKTDLVSCRSAHWLNFPLLSFFFSEQITNRIIALTKQQGDAIDDKVGIHRCFK